MLKCSRYDSIENHQGIKTLRWNPRTVVNAQAMLKGTLVTKLGMHLKSCHGCVLLRVRPPVSQECPPRSWCRHCLYRCQGGFLKSGTALLFFTSDRTVFDWYRLIVTLHVGFHLLLWCFRMGCSPSIFMHMLSALFHLGASLFQIKTKHFLCSGVEVS